MTSNEVLAFVRSMLDDGIDHLLYWHNDTAVVKPRLAHFVHEAQLQLIREKLMVDDARALRPLTVETDVLHIANRNTTPEQRRLEFRRYVSPNSYYVTKMLAMKAVRILHDGAPIETGAVATFMPQGIYKNMHGAFNPLTPYTPQKADPYVMYYTVEPDFNITNRVPDTSCINYTDNIFGTSAHTIWIRYPAPFGRDMTIELPEEYHYDVCVRAAELVNNIDASEDNRGQAAVANLGQRLTMKDSV